MYLNGLINNSVDLNKYFETTVGKWRKKNPKSFSKKVVLNVRALYRQATIGNAPISLDKEMNSELIQIWHHWNKLRGTSKDVAKRRYLSYLYSIDKSFVDPIDESEPLSVPIDFFRDSKTGLTICAWCNTVVGCNQPLLNDTGKLKLEDDFERDSNLLKIGPFISWFKKYELQHRCRFGLHIPIANVDSKRVHRAFNKTQTNAFKAYEPNGKMIPILKSVMNKQFQILYNLQREYKELSKRSTEDNFRNAVNNIRQKLHVQTDTIESFQKFFMKKIGTPFLFEVSCERKTSQCHARKIANGGRNHTHPITLTRPFIDLQRFTTASKLRDKVIDLNTSPCTGSLQTEDRCRILFRIIESIYQKQHNADTAYLSYCRRANSILSNKDRVSKLSKRMNCNALEVFLANGDCENALKMISGNDFQNYEMSNGWTPLIRFTILSERGYSQRLLLDLGADINFINSFGMTALSWACKRDDELMVCTLLDLGAKPHYLKKSSFTPIEVSVRHGRINILKIIFDTIKNMNMFSLTDVLNQVSCVTGDTLLMVCARHRLKSMARFLIKNGADFSSKSENGETELSIARNCGWEEMVLLFKSEKILERTPSIRSTKELEEKQNTDAQMSATNALKMGDLTKVCEFVQDGKIYPDFELACGITPLLCAIRSGNMKFIAMLLRNGCDPCYQNRNGRHALIEAAENGGDNVEIGQILLDYNKSCLNLRDINGNSALFFCSKKRKPLEFYELLCSFQSYKGIYHKSHGSLFQEDIDISDESWKWRLSK